MPRSWLPTPRLARAWWYIHETPSLWQKHPDLEWDDPLSVMSSAVDARIEFIHHVPARLTRLIEVLVAEARNDDEINYIGVAIIEDACMVSGRRALDDLQRARISAGVKMQMMHSMYPQYLRDDFGYSATLAEIPLAAPWWWRPRARRRLRRELERRYQSPLNDR